ncbi:hypothetical protein GF318_04960 [Candidatus Micrarchaeota archaeon]|nr:hypothetical protein [Candidatus Micrarchaeota archaeon]
MELLLDASPYCSKTDFATFLLVAVLAILIVAFIAVNSLLSALLPPPLALNGIVPFCSGVLGVALLFIVFAVVYKFLCMVVDVPLKVYDKGIAIQAQQTTSKSTFVPFKEIHKLELEYSDKFGRPKRRCLITTMEDRKLQSVENFSGMEQAGEFAEKLAPIMEENNILLVDKKGEKDLLCYSFWQPKKDEGLF